MNLNKKGNNSMKKIIIEEPIYEKVQTGMRKIEKWQTSDGEIFDNEQWALQHEFYNIKLNKRGFYIPELEDVTVLDLTCEADLEKYENDFIDSDMVKEYDKNQFQYPNTYVFYTLDESKEDDNYYKYPYSEYHVYCLPLDKFKEMLIKKIQEFK